MATKKRRREVPDFDSGRPRQAPYGRGVPSESEERTDANGAWTEPLPAVVSVAKAAEILTLSAETVCAYIRRGELRASGLGTDKQGRPCPPYAILGEDLLGFLRQRPCVGLGGPPAGAPPRRRKEGNHSGRRRKQPAPAQLVTPRSPR